MPGLALIILAALLLGLGGLAAFIWSLRSGQYDDLDGAAWRIFTDDDAPSDSRTAFNIDQGGQASARIHQPVEEVS